MDTQQFFATEWPQLVPQLRANLAKAGASTQDRDDVIQETALRLLRTWDSIDWGRGAAPLAHRIAMNVWRDHWRRHGRREVIGEVPDQPTAIDTERAALARVEVSDVAAALATLPAPVARVLRIAASEAEDMKRTPPSAAVRMARTRARRALASCARVACAAAAVCVVSVRWVTRPVRVGVALTAAVAGLAVLGGLSNPAQPGHGSIQTQVAGARPASVLAGATRHAAAFVRSAQATSTSAAGRRHTPAGTPFYPVQAGPARAGVFIDLDANNVGAQVRKPAANGPAPVCTYGETPTVPTIDRCPGH